MPGKFNSTTFYNVNIVYPDNFVCGDHLMSEDELVILADNFPENIYFSVGI